MHQMASRREPSTARISMSATETEYRIVPALKNATTSSMAFRVAGSNLTEGLEPGLLVS